MPNKISISPDSGSRNVDILVLTKDDEFLATIKDSSRGLHNVHHAVTPTQAEDIVKGNKIGVLVTDAAMVGSNIEVLTQRLRQSVPRLVAVVAGRRDDGGHRTGRYRARFYCNRRPADFDAGNVCVDMQRLWCQWA